MQGCHTERYSDLIKRRLSFAYFGGSTLIHAHMPTQKSLKHQDEIISGVTSLAFSPDGKNLAVGQKDQSLTLFDVTQGLKHNSSENLTTSYAQQRWFPAVTALTYSPDGNQLLATTAQGSLGVSSAKWHRRKNGGYA